MGLIAATSPLLHRLEYASLDNEQQEVIESLIDVASELIEKYCNRVFQKATFTETLNGSGHQNIIVKNIPIVSITSIKFVDQSTGDVETIDDAEFDFEPEIGSITWRQYSTSSSQFNGFFPEAVQNITVTYVGGFTDVPMPIQMVCAQMVEVMFDPASGQGALEKEKLGEYFYQINAEKLSKLLTDQNKMLAMYRRRV